MSTQLRQDHDSTAKAIIGVKIVAKNQHSVINVEEKVMFKNSVIVYHLTRRVMMDKIKEKRMNIIAAATSIIKRRRCEVRKNRSEVSREVKPN